MERTSFLLNYIRESLFAFFNFPLAMRLRAPFDLFL